MIYRAFKKIGAICAGLILTGSSKIPFNTPVACAESEEMKQSFTPLDLSRELRKLNRRPLTIPVVSAMCYDMSMLAKEVEFQCEVCGKTIAYERSSDTGLLVESLPYLKRSLKAMPYAITIDATGLCPVCGKDKEKALIMNVKCFKCGVPFFWTIKTQSDLNMLQWLYLKIPIVELDGTNLALSGDEIERARKIREGSQYIHDHVFGPECRENILIK